MLTHALVCLKCGEEVALLTDDDLTTMTELPEHRCRKPKPRKDAA